MQMLVQYSLDWAPVSANLRSQMHAAPQRCKKDLSRMIGHMESIAQELSALEVELRRNRKESSAKHQQLLDRLNESINEYEKWLMLAHLQHG